MAGVKADWQLGGGGLGREDTMRKGIMTWWTLTALAGLLVPAARGADWATWRCDAARSADSPEELPGEMHLQWSRQLPAPVPAWPNEPRLHFDAAYQPVVAGSTVVIASPNDGSVRAFDTRSGAERWTFFTDGPVRLAPVASGGKVYAGSDDGWLYCLDASDGGLLWKVRGAPEDRPDRRHLGNNRLVSFWPVRGGPAVAGGTVYFAAGIWPTFGVFVVAVEADTGKLLWRNGELSLIDDVRLDHNHLDQSGLSPQGYLLVTGEKLLVPNGRSMPAALDRRTGKLLYYIQGYRNGDCRVTTNGTYAFVGAAGVTDVGTGREVGSRWADAGADAPDRFVGSKMHLFEGPIFPYKMIPGCSARSVLSGGAAYGLHQGTFYAYDLARAAVSEYEKEHMGHALRPWRWDAPQLWKLATEDAARKPAGDALIKAGRRLYGHLAGKLIAVELPGAAGKQPRIAWARKIDGTPAELVAADGRLLVVTGEGRVDCFGGEKTEPKDYPLERRPPAKGKDTWTRTAAEVLKQTGASEGYCLVMGVGSGRLIDELLGQSKLKIIAVDPDKSKVDSLRTKLVGAGLYGARAEAVVGRPWEFSFPPYVASLIVSEEPQASGFSVKLPAARLLDVLRPYGGTACLGVGAERHEAVARWAAGSGIDNVKPRRAGAFTLLVREGPLAGSAPWTHECADAARSYYSKDRRVKPPLGILWYGDGPGYGFWKRKDYGIGVKPQVAGGRVVAFQITSSTLMAYDVYTGRLLWTRKVEPFTRYATMADAVYVAGGDRCLVLDPATGEDRATFRCEIPGGAKPLVADIRVSDDVILIAAARQKVRVIEKGLWDSTVLVALDRKNGKTLWTREAEHRFNNGALAIGGGRVFCIDSASPLEVNKNVRRGQPPEVLPSKVLALEGRTGKTLWSRARSQPTPLLEHFMSIRARDDWLAWCEPLDLVLTGKGSEAAALAGADGKALWQRRIGGAPWVVRGETFLDQGGQVYDAPSGSPAGRRRPIGRGGCNYLVGGASMLFLRDRSVCLIDAATEAKTHLFAIRSGCSNSLVAADGLLSVPNFAVGCVCNYPIQTSFAMVTMPEAGGWAAQRPARQTVRVGKPAGPP